MLGALAGDVARIDLKPLLGHQEAGTMGAMDQVLADLSAIRPDSPRTPMSDPTRFDQAERLINAVMYALYLRAPGEGLLVEDFIAWGIGPFHQLMAEAYGAQGWPPRMAALVEPHRGLADHVRYAVEATAQQIMAHTAMRFTAERRATRVGEG